MMKEFKKVVNLTPHSIILFDEGNRIIQEFKPSGQVARVSVSMETIDMFAGVPVKRNVYGEIENLPEPDGETLYITSAIVAGRATDRNDIVVPNESVRDDKGVIIGCRSFAVI